jgi:predicted dienelactone hydrolase
MKVVFASSVAAIAFSASHEDVTVGFSGCGGSDNARVYYGSEKGPAISFAHGYTAYGKLAYEGYATLLSQLADAGYVVIVPESSNYPLECADLWKDQVKALNWLKSSSLASKVDYAKKTGVLGHSMGGGATYHTASQSSSITAENIGAAVGMNPQIQRAQLQPITDSLIPIMFTTGSDDTTISPSDVKDAYTQTSGVAKVFAEITGGTHTEPVVGNPQRLNEYILAFFDCHLKSQSSQCAKVYKDASSDALCGDHDWKLTECSHANEPSIEGIMV